MIFFSLFSIVSGVLKLQINKKIKQKYTWEMFWQ